ncbi:MAG: DUF3084 domain-containing protein [Pyramidobacter sp.]|nr:DUF3084 domain-containing protein [Pyramidobacter sp.]
MEESLWELIQEVNWKLIVLTLFAGGALSYIGDRVGMKFAKRRVTLFNLRPRYTSSLITAVTGMIISFCVIAILAVMSETVRTTLFSMQYIQRQMIDLTRQLQDSRNEQQISSLLVVETQQKLDTKEKDLSEMQKRIDQLRADTDNVRAERDKLNLEREALESDVQLLRSTLGRLQEGKIIAFADERLGQEVIPEGIKSEAEVRKLIDRLNERIRYQIAHRLNADPTSVIIEEDSDSVNAVLWRVMEYDSRKVVRASPPFNIAEGEKLRLQYRVFESTLVFEKDEELLTRVIRTPRDSLEAEALLSYMLRELNRMASSAGILNDPLTGTVGDIPANDFYDAVERMTKTPPPYRVTIYAARDVYSEGPLNVRIDVETAMRPDDEHLPDFELPQRPAVPVENVAAVTAP